MKPTGISRLLTIVNEAFKLDKAITKLQKSKSLKMLIFAAW